MHKARPEGGYTYVGLLILLAVLSLVASASLRAGLAMQRRVAENALLERGQELVWALESYARATPQGGNPRPPSVQALLRDPRAGERIVRHLRRLPPDPITGQDEWGIVMDHDGRGIEGFYSRSDRQPLRREFPAPWSDFSDARSYREMVFRAGLGD